MKRILLSLFLALLMASLAGAATIADDFERANSTDIGANWDPVSDGFEIVSGAVRTK